MRSTRVAAVAALAALLGVLVAASPAGAHGGDGNLALVSAEPDTAAGPGAWTVEVQLTYVDDGHTADDATVSLSGDAESGDALTPVALEPLGGGRYRGTASLPAPGAWNLRVVSVEPPAQLSLEPVVVPDGPAAEVPASDGAAPDGAAPDVSTLDAPPGGAGGDEASAGEDVSAEPLVAAPEEGDGGGVPGWVWPLVALAVAAGLVAVVAARRTSAEA